MRETISLVDAKHKGAGGSLAGLVLGVVLVIASLPFTWFFNDSPARDEVGHIPLVQRWIENPDSVSIRKFPEPKGVAFLWGATLWGKLFGSSAPALRTMVVVLTVATLGAWTYLLGLWGLSRRFGPTIAILTVPYFFIYTQMVYTEIPALLLTFLALICTEKLRRSGNPLWGIGITVSLGVLIWVRQTFLIVPLGIIFCSWWMGKYRLRVAGWAALSLCSVIPMLILWGGIVPPKEIGRFGSGGIYLDAFAFSLGVLGVMGWGLLLTGVPRGTSREPYFLLGGLVLAIVLFATMPLNYWSVDRMGLLQKGLISMERALGTTRFATVLPKAVLLCAMCGGGMVLGRLVYLALFPSRRWERIPCALAVLCVLLCLVATPIFYDRYLILTLVMIFAISAERAKRVFVYLFIALFALVTCAHVVYVTRHPTPSDEPVPLGRMEQPGAHPMTGPLCLDDTIGENHGIAR